MEITIDLNDAEIEAIRNIGEGEGNLNYFVDGYYWGETTADCEQAIVKLRKAIDAKQASILEQVDKMLVETVRKDWMTIGRIFKKIKEDFDARLNDEDFKERFSADLVYERCKALCKSNIFEKMEVDGKDGNFDVFRQPNYTMGAVFQKDDNPF